jgi:hypothetical protein
MMVQLLQHAQGVEKREARIKYLEAKLEKNSGSPCQSLQVRQYPARVAARVQYGSGVRSLVVVLNNGLKLSFSNIRQFFTDVFGYELNESTQCSAIHMCNEALIESEAQIKEHLLTSPVDHFDETGLRVGEKLHWLHNYSKEWCTYLFVHPKRGKKALDEALSLIPHGQGWAVHDCWASYFRYDQCLHAICVAHLLRELQALIEQISHWADRMRDLLLYAYSRIQRFISTARKNQHNVFNERVATFNGGNFLMAPEGC